MHAYLNTYLATYHGVDLLWAVANLGQTCRGVSCPLSFSSSPSLLLPPLFHFIVSSQKWRMSLGGYPWILGRWLGGGGWGGGGLIPPSPPLDPPLAVGHVDTCGRLDVGACGGQLTCLIASHHHPYSHHPLII